jgi:hypothetical protein
MNSYIIIMVTRDCTGLGRNESVSDEPSTPIVAFVGLRVLPETVAARLISGIISCQPESRVESFLRWVAGA